MSVKVLIPTPLRNLTGDSAEVEVEPGDIKMIVDALEGKYPGLKERLCDEDGKLRRFVNVYLNEEDIRFMDGEATAAKDGDEVSIVPAIAGGAYLLAACVSEPAPSVGRGVGEDEHGGF